jgi:hypothetical protein
MKDVAMLALTAALTWGMWWALEAWGDMAACWLWAWAWWIAREMGYD